jgi:DNA polymerase-3 subunit alpha
MSAFTHLRARSVFTLSQGASRIGDLLDRAKALGQPSLALTDQNNLYGAMEFSKAAAAAGIQPILACEITVDAPDNARGGVLFLAKNATGYAKICGMMRIAAENADGKDGGTPRLPIEALATEGVLALCGTAPGSLLSVAMAKRGAAGVKSAYEALLSRYGDAFYAEICRTHLFSIDRKLEEAVLHLAFGQGVRVRGPHGREYSEAPLVATSDVWYATPDRHDAWLLLRTVSRGGSITLTENGIEDPSPQRFDLKSSEEMAELFRDLPEALRNASEIAQRCAFMVKGRAPILPAFPTQAGRSEVEELRGMAFSGLEARLKAAQTPAERVPEYQARLDYELSVIEKMGFPGYFLIVADFIQWAKQQGIPVGPGRGSGAGSVVAWALTITDLDPLQHGLLFERFLNPERISMPDFDIDFCQDRRDEVIAYVRERYGADRVAAIATFGEIKSKTALTDMQRIIIPDGSEKVTFAEAKDLTKLIPGKPEAPAEPMGLQQAYAEAQSFREVIDSSPKFRAVYEQAVKIEGLIRTAGMHAAGIVIADRPIDELVPVGFDKESSMPVVGFNLKGAETAGLVKFDFLGLKTLSVMAEAVRHVRDMTGEEIDLAAIPLDDPMVMERYSLSQTTGVFQFESAGMRNVLRQVKPSRFADLIAINALFRPGPMAYIQTYAMRKNGEAEAEYPSPVEKTKPILEETYGIMVYQEQVMQVAQACAGYSLGGADLLRRAMGKKIPAEMAAHRKIFVSGDDKATPPVPGAVKLGMPVAVAEKLFDDIAAFAGYGFNKSHSAAYSWISYQTAWLKTYYPAAFFAALMSYNADDEEKLAAIKSELEALGGRLLPPDINRSMGRFQPEALPNGQQGFAVRYGFSGIKSVSGSLDDLVTIRRNGGEFSSLEDFATRAGRIFNKGQIEKLAEAGAFDKIAINRRQAYSVLTWFSDRKDKAPQGQTDMFGGVSAVSPPGSVLNVPEWGDVVQREFSAFGFYVGAHPIDRYLDRLIAAGVRRRASFTQWMKVNRQESLKGRRLCVVVDAVKIRQSKKSGAPYLEASVSEKEDRYRVFCYEPRSARLGQGGWDLNAFRQELENAKSTRSPVILVSNLTFNNDQLWVNVDEIYPVEKYLENVRGALTLYIDPSRLILEPDQALTIAEMRKSGNESKAQLQEEQLRLGTAHSTANRMVEKLAEASESATGGEFTEFRIMTADGTLLAKGSLRQNAYVHAVIRQLGLTGLSEHMPAQTVARLGQTLAA